MKTTDTHFTGYLEPIYRVNRDLIKMIRQGGTGGITTDEARYLVDLYYTMQKMRVRTNNQTKGLERDAKKAGNQPEPHEGIKWVMDQFAALEGEIKKMLGAWTTSHELAWFFDQTLGVGPVLAAGLLAHIDIRKAPTAGHIWRFAGLDPTLEWKKGAKKPFNGQLKTLCWKIGDSFVKVSNREDAFYGRVYRERKAREVARNDAGELADQAAQKLERFKIGKDTDAYKAYSAGKLPPAHLDMRARRYAVKLFLSHLQYRWYEQTYGEPPAKPYAVAVLEHAHLIEPPQQPPRKA